MGPSPDEAAYEDAYAVGVLLGRMAACFRHRSSLMTGSRVLARSSHLQPPTRPERHLAPAPGVVGPPALTVECVRCGWLNVVLDGLVARYRCANPLCGGRSFVWNDSPVEVDRRDRWGW